VCTAAKSRTLRACRLSMTMTMLEELDDNRFSPNPPPLFPTYTQIAGNNVLSSPSCAFVFSVYLLALLIAKQLPNLTLFVRAYLFVLRHVHRPESLG
jgi:hypothetical protein